MKTPPNSKLVKEELYDLMQLAIELAKEYEWSYQAGYLGVRQRTDQPVRFVGASDPVGEVVVNTRYMTIRSNTASAAERIHQAILLMREARKLLALNLRNN